MKKIILFVLLVSGAVEVNSQIRGFGKLETGTDPDMCMGMSPVEDNLHPRQLFNVCNSEDEIDAISMGGSKHDIFQALVTALNSNWDSLNSLSVDGTHFYRMASVGLVYATWGMSGVPGIDYGAHSNQNDWAAKVVDMYDYAETNIFDPTSACGFHGCWGLGYAMDYIWDYLSTPQKEDWAEQMVKTCENRTGGPISSISDLGSSVEQSLWPECATFSLTLQNSGLDNVVATTYNGNITVEDWYTTYFTFNSRLFDSTGVFAAQTLFYGNGAGDLVQGPSYGPYYFIEAQFHLAEAYRRAYDLTKMDFYGQDVMEFMASFPMYVLFNRPPERPTRQHLEFDATEERDWEAENRIFALQGTLSAMQGFNSDMAALAQWEAENIIGEPSDFGTSSLIKFGGIMIPLMPITPVTAQSPTTLGIYPAIYDSTNGANIMLRRNWTDEDGPLVFMDITKWLQSPIQRNDPCPGGWGVRLNGYVTGRALNVGSLAWGSASRAAACNGVFLFDTTESGPTSAYWDYGGMRWSLGIMNDIADFVTDSYWDLTAGWKVDLEDAMTETTYVWQDTTRSFNGGGVNDGYNPDRIVSSQFAKIYRRPDDPDADKGYFMMSDYVVTPSTDYVPTDVIRYNAEPTLDGTTSAYTISPNCTNYGLYPASGQAQDCPGTGSFGHLQSTNSSYFTATVNSETHNNKIWVKYLTPSLRTIKVGGPNESAQTWTSSVASEFSLEQVDSNGVRFYTGADFATAYVRQLLTNWTTRVQRTTPATITSIIKLVAFGRSTDSDPTFESYSGTSYTCGRADDFIGALPFGASYALTAGTCVFTGLATGTYTLGWGGLSSGTTRTFTPGSDINLGSGAGVAVMCNVDSGGGRCELPMTVTGSGSGAARTITVS